MNDFRGHLRAAKKGDEDAFACIWREFHPGLVRYLRVRAASEADDLAADIWYRVIRGLGSFEGDEGGFRAWLYTSARNRLIDWQRGIPRRAQSMEDTKLVLLPASNNVEDEFETNSATDAAIAMIARLPGDQAEAVMLRTVGGLDVPTVAQIMERSPGAVRVLCHRGLRRLGDLLEDVGPTTEPGDTDDETSRSEVGLHSELSGAHNG